MSSDTSAGKPGDRHVGKVLHDRYRLDELIGWGAMGTVYRATQLTVNRTVAVKILKASMQFNPDVRERFEREARAVARLSHPNCLMLYDFGYSDELDVLYMVVEYLEGDTLSPLMKGEIPFDMAMRIAFQTAAALKHAHQAGITHRDLKPANVMLVPGEDGDKVKVLDFGLARVYVDDEADRKRITQTGQIHGSPAYMSTEQCEGIVDITTAADIYSLGCILYEMLEGELPYASDNVVSLLASHIEDPIPKVTADGVPGDVRQLAYRMLKKDPEDRPDAHTVMTLLAPHARLDFTSETRMPTLRPEGAGLSEPTEPWAPASMVDDDAGPGADEDSPPRRKREEPEEFDDPEVAGLSSRVRNVVAVVVVLGAVAAIALIVGLGFFDDPSRATAEEKTEKTEKTKPEETAVTEPDHTAATDDSQTAPEPPRSETAAAATPPSDSGVEPEVPVVPDEEAKEATEKAPPPAEEPPAEEPPAKEPPAKEPAAEEPAAKEPPAEDRPKEATAEELREKSDGEKSPEEEGGAEEGDAEEDEERDKPRKLRFDY